jgi:hypothetical protein
VSDLLASRILVPSVVLEIVAGILIGPVFDVASEDDIISFLAALLLSVRTFAQTPPAAIPPIAIFQKDSRILFQGDSITDAGRSREEANMPNAQPGLGNGYAWLAASYLLVDRPDDQL